MGFEFKKCQKWAFCFSLFVTLSISITPAWAGGANSGGGKDIELAYKAATIQAVQDLLEFHPDALRALHPEFKPQELLTNLSVPGRFVPSCATEEKNQVTLRFLIQKSAQAYVGAPGMKDNEVALDCRDPEMWVKKFANPTLGDKLLYFHEAIRNNKVAAEKEDGSGVSSSYIAAKNIQVDKRAKALSTLLSLQACWVPTEKIASEVRTAHTVTYSSGSIFRVALYKKIELAQIALFSQKIYYGSSTVTISEFNSDLINGTTPATEAVGNKIYKLALLHGCFNGFVAKP